MVNKRSTQVMIRLEVALKKKGEEKEEGKKKTSFVVLTKRLIKVGKAYLASHKKANSEGYGGSVVRQALVVYGSHRNVNRLRDPRRSSQVKDYKIGQCTTQNNEKNKIK